MSNTPTPSPAPVATRDSVLREFDGPSSSLHTQQMADEIVRLRTQLAPAPAGVRVLDADWWVVLNPSGKVIGASVNDASLALRDAAESDVHTEVPDDVHEALLKGSELGVDTFSFHGYVLSRLALLDPDATGATTDEADRPYRCGAFDTATGEQCVLESDHAWQHIMPSDLVEHPEKRTPATGAGAVTEGMVERVARALWAEKEERQYSRQLRRSWEETTDHARDTFMKQARAAIAALGRETGGEG